MYPYQQSGGGGYPYQGYPPPQQQQQGLYQGYPPPSGGYPPQQGLYQGYPPAGAGGYPPPGAGGYPPPGAGGYPPPGAGGYPPPGAGGYPPPGAGGYPPPGAGGYPPPGAGGYPPQGAGGYPPSTSGYPPTTTPERAGSAYPPLPTSQGSYAGYPPSSVSSGYPPTTASGYPPTAGYPPQGSFAGYPPTAASGYPPTAGYPPQGGYATGSFNQNNQAFGIGGTTNLLTPDQVTQACNNLRNAMKGLGTDEAALISILGKYPPIQMNQIVNGYKSHFGKSLEQAVNSETSGNFGKLCVALSKSILDFDVYCLHNAIAGLGTDEDCLIEILVGRTNSDIQAINRAYKDKYRKSLEEDIKGDTSGYFRALLVALVQGNRDETNIQRDVKADVEALYRAGEGRLGTDESAIISLLCNRPDSHLRQVFAQYQQKYGHSVEKAMKSEFSGDIKKALVNLVKSITNRNEYIAEQFENSMKGMGTKDEKLIRLTVRYRDPVIIAPIKEAYKTLYGKTLKKRIEGDTSGDYRRLLLTCIGEK
ncbi:Annexin [Anaeromyces robustus]|jgi:annexin A7/11|uniref:Annexin n=1 Tax=Anaeromyces robustus TaxID=1754192 RepID=A0A1Y1WRY8_9FUNG|nr:Annexin [Anaeromyces robustus]|eukprot:ORX76313.1 Annexin [Anaeromyces robustus]